MGGYCVGVGEREKSEKLERTDWVDMLGINFFKNFYRNFLKPSRYVLFYFIFYSFYLFFSTERARWVTQRQLADVTLDE